MKKISKTIIAVCLTLCLSICTATANVIYRTYEAVETDIDIHYKWSEELMDTVKFKKSFVIIDGTTYVPLRDVMEMVNVGVEWNGDEREVILHDNSYVFLDNNQIFERLFGFDIPSGATLVRAMHNYDGYDHSFYAKYAVDDKAIETIRENLTLQGFYAIGDTDEPISFGGFNSYKWWNLENSENATEVFEDVSIGVRQMSIFKYVAFTVEAGQNYMYVQHS